MPFCPNCGKQVATGASFCASCGKPLDASSQTPSRHMAADQENPFVLYYLGALKRYAQFDGRASRKEYWMFVLFSFLVALILGFIDGIINGFNAAVTGTDSGGVGMLSGLYNLAVLIPSIAIAIRRMHDVDRKGWFLLVPIYSFILACTRGTEGANRFGPPSEI